MVGAATVLPVAAFIEANSSLDLCLNLVAGRGDEGKIACMIEYVGR